MMGVMALTPTDIGSYALVFVAPPIAAAVSAGGAADADLMVASGGTSVLAVMAVGVIRLATRIGQYLDADKAHKEAERAEWAAVAAHRAAERAAWERTQRALEAAGPARA